MSPNPSVVCPRRVVVRHTAGPFTGISQITGIWEPRPDHEVPTFVPGVRVAGDRRTYGIELVRVSDVAFHYQEVQPPLPEAWMPFAGGPQ